METMTEVKIMMMDCCSVRLKTMCPSCWRMRDGQNVLTRSPLLLSVCKWVNERHFTLCTLEVVTFWSWVKLTCVSLQRALPHQIWQTRSQPKIVLCIDAVCHVLLCFVFVDLSALAGRVGRDPSAVHLVLSRNQAAVYLKSLTLASCSWIIVLVLVRRSS